MYLNQKKSVGGYLVILKGRMRGNIYGLLACGQKYLLPPSALSLTARSSFPLILAKRVKVGTLQELSAG